MLNLTKQQFDRLSEAESQNSDSRPQGVYAPERNGVPRLPQLIDRIKWALQLGNRILGIAALGAIYLTGAALALVAVYLTSVGMGWV